MTRLRWNKRQPACVNCGEVDADRRPHGYCAHCWPSAQKLRWMESWNYSDSATWRGGSYQGWNMWPGITPREYCDAAQELLENELYVRRLVASQLRGEEPIEGLTIEYALRELGRILKLPNPDYYAHWATTIDHTLDEESKRLVYGWLENFLSNRPQRSIWQRAYYRAQRRKNRERDQKRL
jgi:hypothetical protein